MQGLGQKQEPLEAVCLGSKLSLISTSSVATVAQGWSSQLVSAVSEQNEMLINTAANQRMLSQPLFQRRPSVLFKKKVETTK